MNELKKEPFVWQLRVYFEDTDAGGVVYHSRYLNFFERARTEMLRAMGVSQTELREKHNLIWVVLDMNVKFRKAARLDDELLVDADLLWVKGVRQGFRQKMTRISDGATVAEAELSAVMLHADSLKPARMPDWIKAELLQNAE
ncbi:MAG: YbgC/FadM family acyl-CoA thioesterase [Xanthomonadales bacterium]|nr:YbgC/FadM family acyl-CoA thioesterase [Gammaproteobacteria bacterium]NNK51855.1 YbgC/FadM family acyl-CoA thioesterase [Xanthomonadales bacterium]